MIWCSLGKHYADKKDFSPSQIKRQGGARCKQCELDRVHNYNRRKKEEAKKDKIYNEINRIV